MRSTVERYVAEGKYLSDGSLKAEAYLRQIEAAGKNLAGRSGRVKPVPHPPAIAERVPDPRPQ
jgi:hypothetical protein